MVYCPRIITTKTLRQTVSPKSCLHGNRLQHLLPYTKMSFLPSQPYTRTVLRPISVPTQSSAAFERKHQPVQTSSRSITTAWTATVHSFLGTPDRQVSALWLPDKFDEDPSQIPNDPIQNKHYDAASAKPSQEPGVYRMYQGMDEQSPKSLAEVAPPRIVVKRYLPTLSPQANARGKPALTLLMLTGMGLPKEVKDEHPRSSTFTSAYIDHVGF